MNRATNILEWIDEKNEEARSIELSKTETNKLLKWMINHLEVFCWDKDYDLESDIDYENSFLSFVGLPKHEVTIPYWEMHLTYADETEQNVRSFNTALYDNVYELYTELMEYFEDELFDDEDYILKEILLCDNLIELSNLLKSKLSKFSGLDESSAMLMFMEIIEVVTSSSRQGEFYYIYDGQDADIKFLQSYLMQTTAEEAGQNFSPKDKIKRFIAYIENNFIFTNNDKVSADEIETALLIIEKEYELIKNLKPLEFSIFNLSHKEFNSICNTVTNLNDGTFLSEIYLFKMRDEEIKSPLYVFLHEIGHALHFYCTNNSAIIPDSFIRLSNEYLKIPLEQGLEAVEIFADAIAIGLMRIFNWDDKGTFEDMDINIKNAFAAYTDMLLKNLEKIKELEK